jgi:integrase
LASSAYLARFTGSSRVYTESDLRLYFTWCADHQLVPLAMARADVERYVRWMQEVRHFKPSTVSRRMAVVTGFYRTCVIDAVLEHSPTEYVCRPVVANGSPPLGLSHLQFEALLTAARDSDTPFDFALVTMLGLLGLRIFEVCRADIAVDRGRGRRLQPLPYPGEAGGLPGTQPQSPPVRRPTRKHGHITKAGAAHARSMLVEPSWWWWTSSLWRAGCSWSCS